MALAHWKLKITNDKKYNYLEKMKYSFPFQNFSSGS